MYLRFLISEDTVLNLSDKSTLCVYSFEKVDNSFKIAFLSENHLRGLVLKVFFFLFEGTLHQSFSPLTNKKKTALSFFPVLGTVKKKLIKIPAILVPRAHNPSSLWLGSRALA